MSEKFKNGCRKTIDVLTAGIVFLLFLGSMTVISVSVRSATHGAIIAVCWNLAMTTMFGFSKITIFYALILSFTIINLRADYFGNAKREYKNFRHKLIGMGADKKMSNIVAVLLIIIFELISIFITVLFTMYSWNTILPQLLNIKLVQINFWQTLGFAYLFNLLFGTKNTVTRSSKLVSSSKKQKIIKTETSIE